MTAPRCPGQDMRYWKPEDIYEVKCPRCSCAIEFWKDEPMRVCKSCGKEIRNPRIDLGCAKWCKYADECLGRLPQPQAASPVIDNLEESISKIFSSATMDILKKTRQLASDIIVPDDGEPCLITTASILLVADMSEPNHKNINYSDLLTETGLEPETAKNVDKLVKCVNRPNGCQMKECAIVVDIATIIRDLYILPESVSKEKLLNQLNTESAKKYVTSR